MISHLQRFIVIETQIQVNYVKNDYPQAGTYFHIKLLTIYIHTRLLILSSGKNGHNKWFDGSIEYSPLVGLAIIPEWVQIMISFFQRSILSMSVRLFVIRINEFRQVLYTLVTYEASGIKIRYNLFSPMLNLYF